jgi:hypothetical protein
MGLLSSIIQTYRLVFLKHILLILEEIQPVYLGHLECRREKQMVDTGLKSVSKI